MYDEILLGVSFADVALAVIAIAALWATALVVLFGARTILNMISGDPWDYSGADPDDPDDPDNYDHDPFEKD